MSEKQPMSLTAKIMIAMISGLILGIVLNVVFKDNSFVQTYVIGGVLTTVGDIFVAALKMLVVPLVFVSLVGGVTALGDVSNLGRIGLKTLVLYIMTTAIAISLALALAITFSPGAGYQLDSNAEINFEAKEAPPLSEVIINMVPSNPIAAMTEGNMLQIIVFALLFGLAINLAGTKGKHVLNFFEDLNEVIMQMVYLVMKIAPVGIFCLITKTFSNQGMDILLPLLGYFLVMVAALLGHALITFGTLLSVFARINPLRFFKKIRPAVLFAFSTASSSATLPITLDTVKNRIGAKNSVASFTVPLGATINMDGTAIMQGVATVFIANVYQIDLSMADYVTVLLTATLASIGTAGVPGVGLIMLAMVLGQVGLPVEGIALIIGVDRILDMIRTAVNVTGDATVTCLIAKSENAFDKKVFDKD